MAAGAVAAAVVPVESIAERARTLAAAVVVAGAVETAAGQAVGTLGALAVEPSGVAVLALVKLDQSGILPRLASVHPACDLACPTL